VDTIKKGLWYSIINGFKCSWCHGYSFIKSDYCPHCGDDKRKVIITSAELKNKDTNEIILKIL